jgi:cytochrome c-type biogenesis protein CcmH/NrfF
MKRHAFDPTSFVLGLAFAALGLFFLVGDRTAADIGWKWMWPVPLVVLGLLFVISAIRRVTAQREVAELDSERVDAEIVGQDEDEG